MKSARFSFRRKFDDQYTFDLQEYMTVHEFHSIMGVFNQATRIRPPPGPKIFWVGTLFSIWMTVSTSIYLLWIHFNDPFILISLPVFIIVSTLFMVWLHRSRRIKFEQNILEICSRLNATENIRGINFRFIKNGLDVTTQRIKSLSGIKTTYALDIDFDDRFNALKSRRFNRLRQSGDTFAYIPTPQTAYFNHADEKDPSCMFEDRPPSWTPPYNEKLIYNMV